MEKRLLCAACLFIGALLALKHIEGTNDFNKETNLHRLSVQSDYTALEVAARCASEGSIDAETTYHATALSLACSRGDLTAVRILVRAGAAINRQASVNKSTPLIDAAHGGSLETVSFLLDNGASIDTPDIYGRTALAHAALMGHIRVCAVLLERKACPDGSGRQDTCPLKEALVRRLDTIATLLRASGACEVDESAQ